MFETEKFSLIGNALFLDFVNTQKMRDGQPFETLETFADFVAWTIAVELLDEKQGKELFEKWNEDSATADFMREAVNFRNLLREMAENIADGKEPEASTIKAINDQLKQQSGFTEIEKTEKGFEKNFRVDFSEPAKILPPIAESVADFLFYGNFEYLRKCGNSNCVLYFYDITKNHKRRWCSMTACGNLAKASAFYQRKKKSTRQPDKKAK